MILAPLVGSLLLLVPSTPAVAIAVQEPLPAGAESAASSFRVPATVDAAVDIDRAELAAALEGMSAEETRTVLDGWLVLLEGEERAYLEARAASAESGEAGESAAIASDRDHLLARAEETLAALIEKGGQAPEAHAAIARVRAASSEVETPTVPVNQITAQELDTEILKALLRPMTLEQAEEQLTRWLELLQRKSTEVTHAEVGALQSEDAEEVERINARAVDLRAERARLIERAEIVLEAVEKKGGEPEEARKYVESVVDRPPVAGVRAAWVTAVSWLRNPDGGLALALALAKAVGVFLVSCLVAIVLGKVVGRAMERFASVSTLLKSFVKKATRRVVLLLGLVLALGQLGFSMGPVVAAIGAAGLVLGLALQGTLSNFASGLLIMVYRPFDVGDVIATEGPSGKVEVYWDVTREVKCRFDAEGISIPFPQRDVHVIPAAAAPAEGEREAWIRPAAAPARHGDDTAGRDVAGQEKEEETSA